jgi:hypothetical protein
MNYIDLDNEEGNAAKQTTGTSSHAPKAPVRGTSLRGRSHLIGQAIGGETRLETLEEHVAKFYKSEELPVDIYIQRLTPKTDGTAYNNLVIAGEYAGTKAFFIVGLETGMVVTPEDYLGKLSMGKPAFVPTDAFDKKLVELTWDVVGKDAISLDGLLVKESVELTEAVCISIAIRAYDAIADYLHKKAGDVEALKLREAVTPGSELYATYASMTEEIQDVLGEIHRTNFRAELLLKEQGDSRSVNSQMAEIDVASISGYVDIVPSETEIYTPAGPAIQKTCSPLIVVNNNHTPAAADEFGLITIGLTTIMMADTRWKNPIVDNIAPGRDPGVLNKFLQLEGGKKYSLLGKGIKYQQKIDTVLTLINGTPMMGLDIDEYSIMSGAYPLLTIGSDTRSPDAPAARQEVVNTLSNMTEGAFPASFNADEIFDAREFPTGTFVDKTGAEKDLSEIDFLYLLELDPALAHRYIQTTMRSTNSFVEMMTLYRDIGLAGVKITGRKRRLIFTPVFVKTIADAFTASGLSPFVDGSNVTRTEVGYGFMSDIVSRYAAAGPVHFGRERITGSAYTMPVIDPYMARRY